MRSHLPKLRPALALLAGALAACAPAARITSPAPARSSFALASRAALVDSIDALVTAPEFRNMHWGILIVDPERGDTLYSRNAGKLFMPASNQKIVTGAVALTRLGPDFRFRTTYVAGGPVRDSTLEGNLLVVGTGDPSISASMRGDAMAPLRAIADSLRARGIKRILGGVRSGRNTFPDDIWGFGWAYDDFAAPYSAGVDELFFNEGFATVAVYGERPGQPPRVVVRPAQTTLSVRNDARTTAARDSARPLVIRAADLTDRSGIDVTVAGTIAQGDSVVRNIAFLDQERAFLQALREALRERGIEIVGGDVPAAAGDTLFRVSSPTLAEILPHFEKPSQNQIGEILLKTLGLELGGAGTAFAGRRVVEQQLIAWGADSMGFAVRDGSGLSRHDYVSPETIVRVLDAMRQGPHFRTFYDALPIGGVDGTIRSRMRNTPAEGNVHAKTGTIDKARALSGYVTTADGRLLLFSTLANNHTVPNRRVERVQDLILAWLAGTPATTFARR